MVIDKVFLFLDLELFWNNSRKLELKVHRKKNQLLKYLNRESTHTKATFKAIPNGVLNRLAKIASRTDENSKRYLDHANALTRAGLGMKNFLTLKELWDNADEREKKKKRNSKGRGEGNVTLISALGSH